MKILQITYNYPPNIGGMETHVSELSKSLNKKNDVRVLWFNGRHQDVYSNSKRVDVCIDDSVVENTIFNSMVLTAIKQSQVIRRQIAEFEPDIVHAHSMGLCYSLSLVKLSGEEIPIIVTNHSSQFLRRFYSDYRIDRLKQKIQGSVPDYVITPSSELKSASKKITNSTVSMIPNGVDIEKFHPKEEVQPIQHSIQKNKFVVLTTRRFAPKNGMEYLVKSIPYTDENTIFLMAGDGEEKQELQDWTKKQGLEDRAHFLGEVENENLPQYYSRADVSVLPSLKEAISISALESMACGTPVIGTDVGGISELIEHGADGVIVEPRDPEVLGNAINDVKDGRYSLTKLSTNARTKIVNNYSWDAIAKRTMGVYEILYQKT